MSKFIDGSKDPQYGPGVEAHFNGAGHREKPATVGGYTQRWGSKDEMAMFLNAETGVNYRHNGAKGSYPKG